jgi:hypothetical protein
MPSETAGQATPSISASHDPEPGRPYTADDILDAMRDSRRPGGVPDEIETQAVAQAVADAVWTFDGEPWAAMSIGGSCGATTCSLDIVGTRPDSAGEDVWSFAVDPAGSDVTVLSSDLGAIPDATAGRLDAIARNLAAPEVLDGLVLATVRWLPPPESGAYALAYRSGDEEGSCSVDVVLDASGLRIVRSGDPC